MARINLDKPILNLKGTEPLKRDKDEVVTAQMVVSESLVLHDPQEKVEAADKAKRFLLAMRVLKEPEPELKVDDIVLIKKVVGLYHGPLIVGQVFDMLEPGG